MNPDIARKLKRFLHEYEDAVVVKNPDVIASLESGSDVDLLVRSVAFSKCDIVAEFGKPFLCVKRSYVTSMFYEWGQIDLLETIEWQGAEFVSATRALEEAKAWDSSWRVPSEVDDVAICWLTSLLWGGFFKERYRKRIVAAARNYPMELKAALAFSVGPKFASDLVSLAAANTPEKSELAVSSIRRITWRQSLRRDPASTIVGYGRFLYCEISLFLRPALPWIALLGPDGAGKSAVISILKARLNALRIDATEYHWRPELFPLARSNGPVTDPHGKEPRGTIASVAKLGVLAIDWLAGNVFRIKRQRGKGRLVIFDRYHADLLIDPRRYRYGASKRLAKFVFRVFPKPDLVFVLDAPADILRERKQEVSFSESERQQVAYRDFAALNSRASTVDCTDSIEKVADEILQRILKHMRGASK